jgi:GT2 family glycosyltransferase
LRSLIANPPRGDYEIIVVDNGSSDGSLEMLACEFPLVQTIANHQNLGYTAPMNQALRKATGSYLVQLNPDTIILGDAFPAIQNFMDKNPEVGICTPKVLNRDGTLQKQCRRSAARPWDTFTYFTQLGRLFPKSRVFGGYLMTYRDEDEVHPVEAVSGSCMVIRREVIEQIGYLDEGFFAYQEDADFCFRARQAGWQVYYVPQAKIIHYGGEGGTMAHLYRSIITWHQSYFRYYRKDLARDYFFLFNWFFYGLMGLKLVLALIRAMVSQEKYVGSRKP